MPQPPIGPLTCRIVGDGEGPLIVLCHGFGAPGDDLVGLAGALAAPPGTRFAFPEAPIAMPAPFPGMDSRAWWPIDMAAIERLRSAGAPRDLMAEEPEELATSRAALEATLDALETELSPSRMVIGGFSQGAMLATDVVLRGARPLAGLCLFSGSYLAADAWAPRMAARAGLPVYQSHGRQDPLLPFALAERLAADLEGAGLDVTFAPFAGVHEIPRQAVEGASAFLRKVL